MAKVEFESFGIVPDEEGHVGLMIEKNHLQRKRFFWAEVDLVAIAIDTIEPKDLLCDHLSMIKRIVIGTSLFIATITITSVITGLIPLILSKLFTDLGWILISLTMIISWLALLLGAFLSSILITKFITDKLRDNLIIFVLGFLLLSTLEVVASLMESLGRFPLRVTIEISLPQAFSTYIWTVFPFILGYIAGRILLRFTIRKDSFPNVNKKGINFAKLLLTIYIVCGLSIWFVSLFLPIGGYLRRRQQVNPPAQNLGSGPFLYIGGQSGFLSLDSDIRIYDLGTSKLLRTISLGIGSSTYLASAKNGSYILAVNSSTGNFRDNKLKVIDTSTHSVIKTIDIGKILDSPPYTPTVSADLAFIPSSDNDKLAVLDLTSFEIIRVSDRNSEAISSFPVSSDGRYRYSIIRDLRDTSESSTLIKLDLIANKPVKEKVNQVNYITLSLITANGEDVLYSFGHERFRYSLYFLDPSTLEVINSVPLEGFSMDGPFLDQENKQLYILATSGTYPYKYSIYVIDLTNRKLLNKFDLSQECGSVHGFGLGNNFLYIESSDTDKVILLNKETGSKVKELLMPKNFSPSTFIEVGN